MTATLSSIDDQNTLVSQNGSVVDGALPAGTYAHADAHTHCAPAPLRPVSQTPTETHRPSADGTPPATEATASARTHEPAASVLNFSSGHGIRDAHTRYAAAEPSFTGSHPTSETQRTNAVGGFLRDPVLGILADVVDDLENVRIANANRVRQLTRTGIDKDGGERGFGLTAEHPEVAKLILTVQALEAAEKDAIKNLQRTMRKHPLARYQKRHRGIGEKQLARLLASIGDPFWNDLHQRPRTVSELWAFAGLHVVKTSSSSQKVHEPQHLFAAAGTHRHTGSHGSAETHIGPAAGAAPKRQRGLKSNWSETSRKRVWVIASAMPKFPGGHYEAIYRAAREKYADAVHSADCVRCGPQGQPAAAGSALSDGHKHARAVRIVAKEILKDLWLEAREIYATSLPVPAPGGEDARPEVVLPAAASALGRAPNVP